jgi:hypothetical protein
MIFTKLNDIFAVMQLRYLVVMLAVLFCQCNSSQQSEKVDFNADTVKALETLAPAPPSGPVTIENSSFIQRVLDNDLTLEKLIPPFQSGRTNQEVTPNEHVKGNDTVEYYALGMDSLILMKAQGNGFPLNVVQHSNRLTIDTNITVGVSKAVLEQKFKQKLPDNFSVQVEEELDLFHFHFADNKLVSWSYESNYDD